MRRFALIGLVLVASASSAHAAPINTNNPGAFAVGATVETFESTSLTPLALTAYTNALDSSTPVPAAAQLGGQISGLHFHSGGGSFNDPIGMPGTPTALLRLEGGIAGDAHSASNVVGSLEINTENLDLDNFVEIIFSTLQNRVGVWLNPSLGPVTFLASDSTGNLLESFSGGAAGNFVGIERATNEIKFVSIVGPTGFTIDDVTFGRTGTTSTVAEPGSLALLLTGLLAAAGWRSRRNRN